MAGAFQGVDPIATIDKTVVELALRQTMVFGLPVLDADKPRFYWDPVLGYTRTDEEGNPWDWTEIPIDTTKASIQVICAYEFFSPLGRQGSFPTEVGSFTPSTVVFTVLQTEFTAVSGFSWATVGPAIAGIYQKYYFKYFRPTYSLEGLPVYQIHCQAEGAS